MDWPHGKYKTVVVDPPWRNKSNMGNTSGGYRPMPYSAMGDRAIEGLPVGSLLDNNAWLFVWATQSKLPTAINLLAGWDCKYRFTITWHKNHGPQPLYCPRFNSEFIVVGAKGKPRFLTTKAFSTAYFWPRRRHSEKPEEFYALLRRVTDDPRIDVFARRRIAGFDAWGDEAPS